MVDVEPLGVKPAGTRYMRAVTKDREVTRQQSLTEVGVGDGSGLIWTQITISY